jgi:polyphenol oxidase
MLQTSNLGTLGRVRHGFLTRAGGVSRGVFESLNCGYSSGDQVDRVEQNRTLALARLGGPAGSLCTVRQVHGTEVVVARTPEPGRPSRRADALVSDRPGITLGVLSADCAPVLFADPEAGVIGAAHAGWRGALAGVIEATVRAMGQLGARPARIRAAVGPCIGRTSYEVGPDLQRQVLAEDRTSTSLFEPVADSDRLLFDLKGYVLRRLVRAGLEHCQTLGADTFADEARFFSARRTRKAGGERFGLLMSAIALID